MASKYTKQQVIADRRCGLKYFDKAVLMTSKQHVLDETLRINQAFPNTWGPGWPNIHWALVNAVAEIIKPNGDIMQTYALDEALDPNDILYLENATGLSFSTYVHWIKRK